jgi:hypothetical protein
MTNTTTPNLALAVSLALSGAAFAQIQGPSTGSTPYAVPVAPGVTTWSVATVDNTGANTDDTFTNLRGGPAYGMAGIPDGTGAYDNGDGTFTVLINHEHGNTAGATRAHGSRGSFVSEWVINKNTLAVVGGGDLITNVRLWNGTGYTTYNAASPMPNLGAPYNGALGRFCSADLPPVSAFSNGALGTTARIFMNGEEIGNEGRAFAHIATGPNAETSYELPRLGKFSWENSNASPFPQNKTVVIGMDDATPGQVYVYVGNKTNVGSDVDKAGLTNGLLYGVKVTGFPLESRTAPTFGGIVKGGTVPFTMQILNTTGNVSSQTGAQLQANSAGLGITEFLRPEDGMWDTKNPNRFYFATTDRYDQGKDGVGAQEGRSRLWVLEFTNIANPTAGGQLRLLIDGSEAVAAGGLNMMDNIGADVDGQITIVEDVGGQAHNGKFARYNTVNGQVTVLAQHDQARFGDIGVTATAPFTNDEEFSGDIDITDIMAGSTLNTGGANDRFYLFVDQSHYSGGGITTAQVEGGQILVMRAPALPSPINNAKVTRSGAVRDRLTGKYKQNVTVTNTSAAPLAGPFHLAIDNLTPGVTLSNISVPTANVLPLGSPSILVTAGSLGAGASATVMLEFNNSSNGAINYYPRLLNGIATP